MRLELEFHKAEPLTNATAYVVLNGVSPSPDGRPCLTFGCVSMVELDGELGRLGPNQGNPCQRKEKLHRRWRLNVGRYGCGSLGDGRGFIYPQRG